MMNCYSCRNEIEVATIPRRTDTCPNCHAYIHCCWSCRYFDSGKHNQCAEPQAEYQSDKGAANFCEYWEPGDQAGGRARPIASPDKARKDFDGLFRT